MSNVTHDDRVFIFFMVVCFHVSLNVYLHLTVYLNKICENKKINIKRFFFITQKNHTSWMQIFDWKFFLLFICEYNVGRDMYFS